MKVKADADIIASKPYLPFSTKLPILQENKQNAANKVTVFEINDCKWFSLQILSQSVRKAPINSKCPQSTSDQDLANNMDYRRVQKFVGTR